MRGARARAQTDPVTRATRRPAPVHAAATGILYFDGVRVYVCVYFAVNHSIISINKTYIHSFEKSHR